MQGHVFQFTTCAEDISGVCPDEVYEANLAGPDDRVYIIANDGPVVIKTGKLETAGLPYENNQNDPYIKFTTPDIENLNAIKRKYFQKAFEKFQKLARKLTLDQFVEYQSRDVLSLEKLLNDRLSDYVAFTNHLGTSYTTLDNFVKKLEPNTTYYLSKSCVVVT